MNESNVEFMGLMQKILFGVMIASIIVTIVFIVIGTKEYFNLDKAKSSLLLISGSIILLIADYLLINMYMRIQEQNRVYMLLEKNQEEVLKFLSIVQGLDEKDEICRKVIDTNLQINKKILESMICDK